MNRPPRPPRPPFHPAPHTVFVAHAGVRPPPPTNLVTVITPGGRAITVPQGATVVVSTRAPVHPAPPPILFSGPRAPHLVVVQGPRGPAPLVPKYFGKPPF